MINIKIYLSPFALDPNTHPQDSITTLCVMQTKVFVFHKKKISFSYFGFLLVKEKIVFVETNRKKRGK
jgi:hypothetical protein